MSKIIGPQELSPDSGGHHDLVKEARARAERMHAIWPIESRPLGLGEAHRLLDAAAITDVLVTCMMRQCRKFGRKFPHRRSSGEYAFPFFPVLLPVLREWSWGLILDGRFSVSGISADDIVNGNRFAILPDRLKLLEPDFERSSLKRYGKEVVCDVLVKSAPTVMQDKKQTRRVPDEEMKACFLQIVGEWPKDAQPPGRDRLHQIVTDRLGPVGVAQVREARTKYAPAGWQTGRGRPCGKGKPHGLR